MQTIKNHIILLVAILLWSCVSVFAGEVRTTHFLKDSYANGERTVKSSGENAAMFVNAEFAGGTTNTSKFSLYVSPYLVANQGGRYTKHIYIGSQRIVSKLGDLKSYGADPRRIEYAGSESDGPKVDYKAKYALQQQVIKDNFAHFDVPYNGADNNDYVDGKGFSEKDGSLKSAMLKAASLKDNFQQGDSYEQYQYFYHPDHLGSSSFITNTEGEVVQHIEYVPYGEVFIEERNNVWNTPYLFNAKEFDEETGLYYYGARYYDPRLAMWLGVDRYAEKYPTLSGYSYCGGNPMARIDVNGDSIFVFSKGLNLQYKNGEYYNNGKKYEGRQKRFHRKVMEALKNIENSSTGNDVVETLQKSRFAFTIKKGRNQFIPNNRINSCRVTQGLINDQIIESGYEQYVNFGEIGSGGDIYWNYSKSGGLDENYSTFRPAFIGLSHEMGHAYFANYGMADYRPENIASSEGILSVTKDEYNAMYIENSVRRQLNIPLRISYSYDKNNKYKLYMKPKY